MSLYGAFDKTKHLEELADPLDTQEGVLSPATRRARMILNLFGDSNLTVADITKLADVDATAAEINAAADVSARVVEVPDAATYTVLAANSGKTHILPNLTADITIALPAVADGLEYSFWYGGVAADAQDWALDTGSDTNYYVGGVAHLDTDAGSAGDEVVPVAGDGNSNSILNVLVPGPGTRVDLACNGTLWYVNGVVVGATAPTFADQA